MKKNAAWIITLVGMLVFGFVTFNIGYYGWPKVDNPGGALAAIGAGLFAIALIAVITFYENKVIRAICGIVLLFGGVAVVGLITSNGTHLGGVLAWVIIIASLTVPPLAVGYLNRAPRSDDDVVTTPTNA
jgi:hypothetical protein